MLNRFREVLQMLVVNHTGFGKSIAETFIELVFGMIELGSVKHKKLAQATGGLVVASGIRTIERFFAEHFVSSQSLGLMIYELLNLKQHGKLTIILDRTNWMFGTKYINIFVATVVLGNTSVPIALEVFDSNKSTNFVDRKAILDQIINLIGLENIKIILADREFVGEDWMRLLYENKIPFTIRIRDNIYVENNGFRMKARMLVRMMGRKEVCEFKIKLAGMKMRLAATFSCEGEIVLVVAPAYFRGELLKRYRIRWLIELYFKSIKTSGFNIEETHMTASDRIKGLMAVIAFASALAVAAGRIRCQIKKIKIKKHGRPAYSIFTYGLDLLRSILRRKIVAPISLHISPHILTPWSEFLNLLFSFILGHKNVGY